MIDATVPDPAGSYLHCDPREPSMAQRPFPFDRLTFAEATARSLRRIARAWIVVALAVFLLRAWRTGVPSRPRPPDWDIYADLALLALLAFGAIVAWRREGAGAVLLALGAAGMAAVAAVEHEAARSLLMLVVFLTPAVLFWLSWQRRRSMRAIGLLFAVLAASLILTSGVANRVYEANVAPVQPESATTLEDPLVVSWIWSGAVTGTSAEITAAIRMSIADRAPAVQLAVSEREDMADARLVDATIDDLTTPPVLRFALDGLTPDTDYWYAATLDGELDLARKGYLRTFPDGPASFTFAFGSSAETGSNGAVFDTIREAEPRFFLSLGDFFYGDIDENDPGLYRDAYDETLTAPAQAALYRSAPVAYMWDDHDFGPNNSDALAPGREAAQAVYRQVVPHYPLAATDDAAIYQAFTVGRVRVILTDNYSYRSPDAAPDGPKKTMLGDEQESWLKQQLLDANGAYPVIIWGNSQPWIATAGGDTDGWGFFATEREEIASFIVDNDIQGLMMLSGDAHALAIDDGSNTAYGGDAPGFPLFHASALDRPGSEKGGPYSRGIYPGGGQFGLVTVNDDGGPTIEIVWSGRTYAGEEIVGYRFTVDAPDTDVPVGTPAAAATGPLAMVTPVDMGIRHRRAG